MSTAKAHATELVSKLDADDAALRKAEAAIEAELLRVKLSEQRLRAQMLVAEQGVAAQPGGH